MQVKFEYEPNRSTETGLSALDFLQLLRCSSRALQALLDLLFLTILRNCLGPF